MDAHKHHIAKLSKGTLAAADDKSTPNSAVKRQSEDAA